ncbi:unnamed protein product [Durusdinium trenchii]|uniref:PDZ domain-containing protein n=1 Tax=Durusdinium trenchii TaxID=1381693 RepID=A0ABP0JH54_9DINO
MQTLHCDSDLTHDFTVSRSHSHFGAADPRPPPTTLDTRRLARRRCSHQRTRCAAGLSPELAINSLDTALSSGDETVILGALDAVSSLSIVPRMGWDWEMPPEPLKQLNSLPSSPSPVPVAAAFQLVATRPLTAPAPARGARAASPGTESRPHAPLSPLLLRRNDATASSSPVEEASASPNGEEASPCECFRLRHVRIKSLLPDGTLGLLLHGTSVVGFCSEDVAEHGWLVGDQIVEINGHRISAFDEFLERFLAAQVQGFPIVFSVLRRELETSASGVPEGPAADPLEHFFSETDFGDLADQLKNKFPPQKAASTSTSSPPFPESILENPYIQALRKRRSELSRSPEGWSEEGGELRSLAAKMASERNDALAMLSKAETPRLYESSRCSPGFSSCITFRPCREKDVVEEFRASDDPAAKEEATNKKMEALSSAAGVVGASSASPLGRTAEDEDAVRWLCLLRKSDCLARFGDVASNLLSSEAGAGGEASATVADQASGALTAALDAARRSQWEEGRSGFGGEERCRAVLLFPFFGGGMKKKPRMSGCGWNFGRAMGRQSTKQLATTGYHGRSHFGLLEWIDLGVHQVHRARSTVATN